LASTPAIGVPKFSCSGDFTLSNPRRFGNGPGDFDAVDVVLESTRLDFLLESHEDPNNPNVHLGVFGSVLLFSGVDDIVKEET